MGDIKTIQTTHEYTPEQALLSALEDIDEHVEALAVIYKVRDSEDPTFVSYPSAASKMKADTLYFLGAMLQERALGGLE